MNKLMTMAELNENNEEQVTLPTKPRKMQETRHSKMNIKPPIKLTLLNEIYLMESEEHDNDPCTYQEAMNDKDIESWKWAMESEMDSMYSHQVWTLVDKPEGIKPIGCKWVYKRNIGPSGKVETYKARLVAKGY